tara:strand:- start:932 stop:2449 length:1518 start_codon:yes stop_codon:yes gene_type:complete
MNLDQQLTDEAFIERMVKDFAFYAQYNLTIRPKSGQPISFMLNKAQHYIHTRLEAQRNETGKVRALILKGRQQGCSTYVEGRFYWKVTNSRGVRAFILTHEQEATNNLFEMVERYNQNCPASPQAGASNAKEISFPSLDSGYRVGTAGTKGVGRSGTVQLFHGSEVAFWPHAETHAAGVIQSVPNDAGTEIIQESTANGLGNYFHQKWQEAEAGLSEYIAIFVPWYWQNEYTRDEEDFMLTPKEAAYAHAYSLTQPQLCWRRNKIKELGSEWLFKQEYPATPSEAFQVSGEDRYIEPESVLKARNNDIDSYGPLIIGVDPARFGDDRTSIIRRRTRKCFGLQSYSKKDTMEVTGLVVKIIKEEKPAMVFVDVGGLGAGVVDRLNELGYGLDQVIGVNGGEKPMNGDKYFNKRAEMWGEGKEWLADPAGVQIPDSDTLQADLTGPSYSYDSATRLKLEKKEDMKKRGIRSPDEGDAWALTFSFPVSDNQSSEDYGDYGQGSGAWMS